VFNCYPKINEKEYVLLNKIKKQLSKLKILGKYLYKKRKEKEIMEDHLIIQY
jgi:hypothetical protein